MILQGSAQENVEKFMVGLKRRNPHQLEFHQAVEEFVETVMPTVISNREYQEAQILERLTEPDRVVSFRVCWQDDQGNYRTNRAWRVQFNNTIGAYKGGLRFHPSVTLSVLKFLGFEQIFKNSLTGLPMGGGKGGSNFNPRGKSDSEVMRFCQSLMTELCRHIGEDTDVPAGDIGVGAREIGYLFGQWKRVSNRFVGVLTGKGLEFGGSLIRKEATGYGTVYFVQDMLKTRGEVVEGKKVVISGSGNVATYAAEKVLMLGGTPVSLSDSGGSIYDPDGITLEKLAYVKDLKEVRRGRISEYAKEFGVEYREGKRPWQIPCDIALPCATQNELEGQDAADLIKNGCVCVAEGANMPSTLDAMHKFLDARILFGPAKAANAGGVAVSGLEQSQNAQRLSWAAAHVDEKLDTIMEDIHDKCVEHGTEGDFINYVKGANVAGFKKVANAMLAYGVT
jgi:glutamate dehydrogenase (NADP+)